MKRRTFTTFILMLAALVVLAFGAVSVFAGDDSASVVDMNPILVSQPAQAQPAEELSLARLYEQVSPSVVAISVLTNEGGGSGSGFVFDRQGHIITNNHVVDGATEIQVEFFDGTLVRAEIVGLDPDSDIAVIKVDLPAERLFPVTFADSNTLIVGEEVFAIGSPFGQRWTLTSGIISALDRTIQGLGQFSIGGVVQTDASINPGNSGGPLLNMTGQVVGVNSQILSGSRSSSGIGFAVPANLTQRVTRELIDKGAVRYSYIGIAGGNVSLPVIESLGLPNDTRGIVVGQTVEDGPAAQAGLMNLEATESGDILTADIITAINGAAVSSMEDLIAYLASNTRPGDTVTLTVLRDGKQSVELSVTLTERV